MVEIAPGEVGGQAHVGLGELPGYPFVEFPLAEIGLDLHLKELVILLRIGRMGRLPLIEAVEGVGLLLGALNRGGL